MLLQETIKTEQSIKYQPKETVMKENKNKRITYIDTAKAIAIFLTLLSHSRIKWSSY